MTSDDAQRGDYESAAAVADLVHPLPADAGGLSDVDDALPGGQRVADGGLPVLLSLVDGAANPATVPHCGQCDPTRHRETPFGVIRCPECHPRAEEAS